MASPGALILAAAVPVLFLHSQFQPAFSVGFSHTTLTVYLSDIAALAVVVAALVAALRTGAGPLRPGRALWLAGALFFAWVVVEVAYGHVHASSYATTTHAVTAAKFLEYALIGVSVPLLLRRRRDVQTLLWSVTLWSWTATIVGVAQFFGARITVADVAGRREGSFLGESDFSALSAAAILIGIVAIAVPRLSLGRRLGAAAAATGIVGMILAGAMASVLGVVTATGVLGIVLALRREFAPRPLAAATACVAVVVIGAVAIRGNDLETFARFLGAPTNTAQAARSANVQTYSQRTLLVWIGYRIWKSHPLLGVGWEGSGEPANFAPYLPAARRRFPDVAPLAFPADAPGRRYGVQNAWVQSLSDLGVIGFVLWLAPFLAAGRLALRESLATGALVPLLSLTGTATLFWLWASQGFVAGIPLDALTAIVFGLAATKLVDA